MFCSCENELHSYSIYSQLYFAFYFAGTKLNNNNRKMSSRNPWSVNNINEFWFLTCPECAFKTKEQHKFQSHAVQNHPQSFELFNNNSKEFVEKIKSEEFDDELSDIDLQDVPPILPRAEIFKALLTGHPVDNDQDEFQYKKKEIKSRSNMNKKSVKIANPEFEPCKPTNFEAPKMFKYRTTSKVHLNQPHLMSSRNTNYFKLISCDLCSFQTLNMFELDLHMKSYCPRRQMFTCSICKEDFSQKKTLTTHMQSAHGKKRMYFDFKCPECNFSSMSHNGLVNHIRIQHL